jgi:hypothetical protein
MRAIALSRISGSSIIITFRNWYSDPSFGFAEHQRDGRHVGFMYRVVADIAVGGVQRIAIERVEVGADFAGQFFQIAVVVVAQRGLRNRTAVAAFCTSAPL